MEDVNGPEGARPLHAAMHEANITGAQRRACFDGALRIPEQ